MSRSSPSKDEADALFENHRPDEFGVSGKTLPLVISTLAMVGEGGEITVRLQVSADGRDAEHNFGITPTAAGRLAAALSDCVNATGQFEMRLTMHDLDKGRSISVHPEKRRS